MVTILKPPIISEVFLCQKSVEGIKYKSPETTQNELRETLSVRDDKTPYNDKKTAVKFILACQKTAHIEVVKRKIEEVRKIWNL